MIEDILSKGTIETAVTGFVSSSIIVDASSVALYLFLLKSLPPSTKYVSMFLPTVEILDYSF